MLRARSQGRHLHAGRPREDQGVAENVPGHVVAQLGIGAPLTIQRNPTMQTMGSSRTPDSMGVIAAGELEEQRGVVDGNEKNPER